MSIPDATELRAQAEALRAEVARIERIGLDGLGRPLEPHDLNLLRLMRHSASLLDSVAGDEPAESPAR